MSDDAELMVLNAALAALGNEPLTDLNDDSLQGSGAAYKLLRSMDLSRQTVLSRHGWLCALEYTTLTPEPADAGNWKYPWQYRLPADALIVWEVAGECLWLEGQWACANRWQTATIDSDLGAIKVLRGLGQIDPLPIAYVRDAGWSGLSASLLDAIGLELAGRCCYGINGDRATASDLKNQAEKKIALAIGAEAKQEGEQDPLAPSIPAMIRNRSR